MSIREFFRDVRDRFRDRDDYGSRRWARHEDDLYGSRRWPRDEGYDEYRERGIGAEAESADRKSPPGSSTSTAPTRAESRATPRASAVTIEGADRSGFVAQTRAFARTCARR